MSWINVKDRLPDENIPVLVSDCEQYMIAFLSKEKKIFVQAYTWDDGIHEIITHWMPLPESPSIEDSNLEDLHPRELANDLINELAQKKDPQNT